MKAGTLYLLARPPGWAGTLRGAKSEPNAAADLQPDGARFPQGATPPAYPFRLRLLPMGANHG